VPRSNRSTIPVLWQRGTLALRALLQSMDGGIEMHILLLLPPPLLAGTAFTARFVARPSIFWWIFKMKFGGIEIVYGQRIVD